ncbi:MAG: hypothetical protein ACSLFR_10165 [Solirubrobacteraceae bacterium]
MGRMTITAAVLTAAALGAPQAAPAAPVQDFEARIDGRSTNVTAGSKRSPRTHALRISTGTRETTAGVLPPTTSRAQIYFPRGARFNGRFFRDCASSRISAARSTDDCPSGSVVGDGEAAGDAPGGITQNDLKITAVNGTDGAYVNLFVEGRSPLRIQSNIKAALRSLKSSTYSYRLDLPIPQNLQEPAPGVRVAVTNFEVSINKRTVRRRGDRIGYIESTSCPRSRTWRFKGVFQYADGQRKTVTDTVRCRR